VEVVFIFYISKFETKYKGNKTDGLLKSLIF